MFDNLENTNICIRGLNGEFNQKLAEEYINTAYDTGVYLYKGTVEDELAYVKKQ